MKTNECKRWLIAHGVEVAVSKPKKHIKLYCVNECSVPRQSEIRYSQVEKIKKQLGLKRTRDCSAAWRGLLPKSGRRQTTIPSACLQCRPPMTAMPMNGGAGILKKLAYPARLEGDGAGYVVTFRDIPEAHSCGSSLEEAIEMAADALATAMEFYFEARKKVPMPTKVKKGEAPIVLPIILSAKILLLNEMLRSGVSSTQLARMLHATPQAIKRILDVHHATNIDALDEAFRAMGRKLV